MERTMLSERGSGSASRNRRAAWRVLKLVTVAVVSMSGAVYAEAFPHSFVAPPELPEQAGDTLQRLAHKHANDLYRRLRFRIDEVDRSVGLNDQQKALLTLAAKGAVQDTLDEWLAPILSALSTGKESEKKTLLARLGGPAAVEQRQVFVQDQLAGGGRVMRRVIVNQRDGPINLKLDESTALRHDLFASTFKMLLTGEQLEKLEEIEAAHAATPVVTQADRLVNEIAQRLSLDAKQRGELTTIIEKLKQVYVVRWLEGRSGIPTADAANFTLRVLPLAEMKRILTPAQFELWSESVLRDQMKTEVKQKRQFKAGF